MRRGPVRHCFRDAGALGFVLWLTVLAPNASAVPTLVLPAGGTVPSVAGHLEMYEESGTDLQVEQVAQLPDASWEAVRGAAPYPGYSDATFWLRLNLQSAGEPQDLTMVVAFAPLDVVELFQLGDDGRWSAQLGGDSRPFSARPIDYREPAFHVHIREHASTLYLRVRSEGLVSIPITLYRVEELLRRERGEHLFFGLFYGFCVAMAFFNLLLFFVLHDRAFAYYVAWLASLCLVTTGHNGLTHQYLLPELNLLAHHSSLVAIMFSVGFGLLFTRDYLRTRSEQPMLDRALHALTVISFAASAISLIAYGFIARVGFLIMTCGALLVIVAGIRGTRRGFRGAGYAIAGFSVYAVGLSLTGLATAGVLPRIVGQIPMQIGLVGGAVLLALGLGDRIRIVDKARQEAEGKAVIDPLTGVPNRRGYDRRVATEWARCRRLGEPISLLMVDIDHFKRFNDNYGHVAGDECLKRVSSTLADSLRESDYMARFGGDELVLLLSAADSAAALAAAERFRQVIEGLAIPHQYSSVGSHVSVSIGIATCSPPALSPLELLRAADDALYHAKDEGRARVVQHFDDMPRRSSRT